MLKNKYFVLGLSVVCILVILFVLILFVDIIAKKDKSENAKDGQTFSYSDHAVDSDKKAYKYLLKATKETVSIYIVRDEFNEELEFYDYAAINLGQLSPDDRKNIETGIYFDNEKELYKFLEAYSS